MFEKDGLTVKERPNREVKLENGAFAPVTRARNDMTHTDKR